MTEDQGVTEPDPRAEGLDSSAHEVDSAPASSAWSVEGWETPGDGGLSDTVVRIPRITDDMAPPQHEPTLTAPIVPPIAAAAPVLAAAAAAGPAAPVAPAAPRPAKPAPRTRKARLRVARIDPWSVMKTAFLFSIAFGIMFWVGTWLLWTVVVQSGLFDAINSAMLNLIQNPGNATAWRIEDYVNTNKVLGVAALIAVINVVISTALGTLFAFLYNLSANVLGGLELTLAED